MNNASISLKTPESVQELTQEREAKLVRTIQAVEDILGSKSWSTLKEEIFDDLLSKLERELKEEARKENPDTNKLNRITGEMKWAERFADLTKLENTLRVELQGIRKRNHEQNDFVSNDRHGGRNGSSISHDSH